MLLILAGGSLPIWISGNSFLSMILSIVFLTIALGLVDQIIHEV